MLDSNIWVLCLLLCFRYSAGLIDKTDQKACVDLVKGKEPLEAMHHCLSMGLRTAALIDLASDKVFALPPQVIGCPRGNDGSGICLLKEAENIPNTKHEVEILGAAQGLGKNFASLRRLGVGITKAAIKSIESGPLMTLETHQHPGYVEDMFLSTYDKKFFFKNIVKYQAETTLAMMKGFYKGKMKTPLFNHLKRGNARSSFITAPLGIYKISLSGGRINNRYFALIPDSEMHFSEAAGKTCFVKRYDSLGDGASSEEFFMMRTSRGFGLDPAGCQSLTDSIKRDTDFLADYGIIDYNIFFTYATGAGCNTDICRQDGKPGSLQLAHRPCMKVDHKEGPKLLAISLVESWGRDDAISEYGILPWVQKKRVAELQNKVMSTTYKMCPTKR